MLTGPTSVCRLAPHLLQAPGCGPGPRVPLGLVALALPGPPVSAPLLGFHPRPAAPSNQSPLLLSWVHPFPRLALGENDQSFQERTPYS